ncbi:uncharacterized protein PADG_11987 [Paracoccidioides brasiliensis Pb18]|uniref:Uncharacterized protein n=1 Tax=Paracoccidioides brasiliensis (strain Pb18) TaxID=502780 RepID=A0A0A0HWS8_PARBD|nr:uncharacterized protein PADG_11987 [Paracoccidioides brasiliensis Pb18]KGM91850.1 hypothetical protein PADG_11987 [Paracoccidioides brasiliensis Pb18]
MRGIVHDYLPHASQWVDPRSSHGGRFRTLSIQRPSVPSNQKVVLTDDSRIDMLHLSGRKYVSICPISVWSNFTASGLRGPFDLCVSEYGKRGRQRGYVCSMGRSMRSWAWYVSKASSTRLQSYFAGDSR